MRFPGRCPPRHVPLQAGGGSQDLRVVGGIDDLDLWSLFAGMCGNDLFDLPGLGLLDTEGLVLVEVLEEDLSGLLGEDW